MGGWAREVGRGEGKAAGKDRLYTWDAQRLKPRTRLGVLYAALNRPLFHGGAGASFVEASSSG